MVIFLLKVQIFTDKPYCLLEDLDQREFALTDPRGFLAQFPNGAILDEVQHCPALFSYLQGIVDQDHRMGLFILTGSQQFVLNEKISQSLAGRVGYLQLLPFDFQEIGRISQTQPSLETLLFNGAYPPVYDRPVSPDSWYGNYNLSYLERDVQQLMQVRDLTTFQRFLRMCAARTGQLLNLSSLANDCGITHNTAKAWLTILEASYLTFRLQPHHQNFNKRLVKTPKLYFYDTGLLCALLGIQSAQQLQTHAMRGALFESWVISEMLKARYNRGQSSNLFFWRDSTGREVDVIIDQAGKLIPVEIKAGQTIVADYFKGIKQFSNLAALKETDKAYLVYGGDQVQQRHHVQVVGWQKINQVLPMSSVWT